MKASMKTMISAIIINTLVAGLISCGTAEEVNSETSVKPLYQVDEDLIDKVDGFYAEMLAHGIEARNNIPKSFSVRYRENMPELGVCFAPRHDQKRILIRKGLTPLVEKIVIYHEMGHCLYNMPHWGEDNYKDIMNVYTILSDRFWAPILYEAIETFVWSIKNDNKIPQHGDTP